MEAIATQGQNTPESAVRYTRPPFTLYLISPDCGDAIVNGGAPVSSGCSMLCNGNASEYCGGPNRLDVYHLGAAPTSTAKTTAPPTTTSATSKVSSTITTTSASGSMALPTPWAYKGCWIDNVYGRILNTQIADNSTMTIESCVSGCIASGYSVAGIEYSTQCSCGDLIQEGGALASSEQDCSMACGGNANEKCGGPNRLSVFSNGTLTVLQPPVVQNSSLPGSWKYQGCVS